MVTIVTGAARGLGAAIATRLAARGDVVVLLDRTPAHGTARAIRDAGGMAGLVLADLSRPAALPAIAAAIERAWGPIDVLVNNAGISRTHDILGLDLAAWRDVLGVNLDGTFAMCASVLPGMVERGRGAIVNVASSSILTSTPGMTAYMASKGGVIGLTSGLANDVGRHGVTVNAVSPGMTRTPIVEEDIAAGRLPVDVLDQIVAHQAIPREGTAGDLAGLVAFLTGPEATFITGQFIVADGGMTRH